MTEREEEEQEIENLFEKIMKENFPNLVKKKKMYREPTVKGETRSSNQRFGLEGKNKHSTRKE